MSATGNQQEPYTHEFARRQRRDAGAGASGSAGRAATPTPTFAATTSSPNASVPGKPGIPSWRRIRPASTRDLAKAQRNKLAAEAAQDRCDRKSPRCRGRAGEAGGRGRQGQRAGQGRRAVEGRRRGAVGRRKKKQIEEAKSRQRNRPRQPRRPRRPKKRKKRLAAEKKQARKRNSPPQSRPRLPSARPAVARHKEGSVRRSRPKDQPPQAAAVASRAERRSGGGRSPIRRRRRTFPGCCNPNCGGSAARPAKSTANGMPRPAGRFRHSTTMPGPNSTSSSPASMRSTRSRPKPGGFARSIATAASAPMAIAA